MQQHLSLSRDFQRVFTKNLGRSSMARIRAGILLASAAVLSTTSSQAATAYWNGTNSTWLTSTNWAPNSDGTGTGVVPDGTTDVVFNNTTVNGAETITLGSGTLSDNSLTFTNTGTTLLQADGIARTLNLGVGGITVNSGAGAVNLGNTAAGRTVSLVMSGSQTFTNNSSSVLSIVNGFKGSTTGATTLTLVGTGTGGIGFGNVLSDGTGGAVSVVVNMTGTGGLSLGGGNFSGGLTIKAGTVTARAGNMGAGTIFLGDTTGSAAATLSFLNNGSTVITNDITVQAGNTGVLTLNVGQADTDAFNLTLNNTNSNLIILGSGFAISGTVSGAGGLTATGSLTMSGNNTYAGGTVLNTVGTLRINSQGTSSTNSAIGTGTLTISGGTLDNTSGSAIDLTGTTNNAIVINGNFTFTGTNNLNLGSNSVSLGTAALTSRSITVTGGTLTIGGVISNGTTATALTKAGAGVLALGGLSTYTGVTSVTGGTLSVSNLALGGSASAIGQSSNAAASLLLSNGTTFKYTGGAGTSDRAFTIAGTIAGHGASIDASGTGALNLSGTATPAYGTNNQTRTLTLTGTNTGANTLAANVANNGTGAVTLTKAGSGTWIVSGTSVFTGGVNLNGGTLQVKATETAGTSGALGKSGTISFGGGTLQYSSVNNADYSGRFSAAAGQAYSVDTNGQSVTWASALTSSGGTLSLNDTNGTPGVLTLSGASANTFSGLTSVLNGELDLGKTSAIAVAGNLTVGDGTGAANTATVKLLSSNQIATTSAVSLNSDGRLAMNGFSNTVASLTSDGGTVSGGNLTVTTAPTFSGNSTIASGATVTSGSTSTLTSGSLKVDGTLASGLAMSTTTSLSGTGTVGAVSLAGSNTLSSTGTLTTGGIVVSGTGNSISSGTVTGPITFSGTSALKVNGTASGSVTVSNNATLSGTGTTGATEIQSGGHLAPGNSVGTMTMASLTLDAGSILDFEFNGSANDFTSVTGTLTLNGGTFNLYNEGTLTVYSTVGTYDLLGYSALTGSVSNLSVANMQPGYTYTFVDNTTTHVIQLQVATVPEPGTWAMMAGGLGLLILIQSRRRKNS